MSDSSHPAGYTRVPVNAGHGHVRPRPDGAKARCGGPALCRVCQREAAALVSDTLSRIKPKYTQRRIVGFTGIADSGKSTAAKHLIERHGFVRGKFAGALKEMLRTLLRYRGVDEATIERMIEGDLKEVPSPHLNGKTPRWAMQSLGTEWGRVCISETLWIDTEMDAKADEPAVVFDDVRFENEARAILAAGGSMVRVERPDAKGASTPGHSSETEVARLPVSTTIKNDGGPDFLAELSYIFGD